MELGMKSKMMMIVATTMGMSICLCASAGSGLVIGTTVELTFDNREPGREVEIKLGSNEFDATAGIYNWVNGLETFCIQLTDSIHEGQMVSYDIVAVPNLPYGEGSLGSARATLLNDLYKRWFDQYEDEGWTNRTAAAFQIVIWEIRHETSNGTTAAEILEDLNIEHGYAEFDSSHAVNNKAEELLDSLGGHDRETFMHYDTLVCLTNDHAQDHITPGSNPQAVPGALGLASGLGLLGLRHRRRKSRRA